MVRSWYLARAFPSQASQVSKFSQAKVSKAKQAKQRPGVICTMTMCGCTDRQTDRQTDKPTDRKRKRERERERGRGRETCRQPQRQKGKNIDAKTDIQNNREPDLRFFHSRSFRSMLNQV